MRQEALPLFEAGYVRQCVKARMACRYMPCTQAQGVACCAECPTGCHNPCKASGRKTKGR